MKTILALAGAVALFPVAVAAGLWMFRCTYAIVDWLVSPLR